MSTPIDLALTLLKKLLPFYLISFPLIHTLVLQLQLLEGIQDSVLGIEESMVTTSAVLNLERRLDVLERQAAENQLNLVRK